MKPTGKKVRIMPRDEKWWLSRELANSNSSLINDCGDDQRKTETRFVAFFDKIDENWKELKSFDGDFESYKVEQITAPELCQPTYKDH